MMLKRSCSLILICVLLFTGIPMGTLAEGTALETAEQTVTETTESVVEEPAKPSGAEEKPAEPKPTEEKPQAPAETDAPATDAPTDAPATDAPATDEPTDAPATDEPTDAPVTDAPATDAPTDAPVTEEPTEQPSYALSVSPATLAFAATDTEAQTVTVRNDSNAEVNLTLGASEYFALSALSNATLAAGDAASFTIAPKAELTAGSYDETILVSAAQGVSASVTVHAEVAQPSKNAESPALKDAAMLVPPTRVSVWPLGYNKLEVTWTAADNGTGYEVQRSRIPDFSSGVTTFPVDDITTESFGDTGLEIGRVYYYRIRTVDATTSPYSYSAWTNNEVSSLVAPLPPESVSVVAVNATSAKLTWTNAYAATGVFIYRNGVQIARVAKNSTSYTDTGDNGLGLTIGVKYTYTLTSYYTKTLDGISTDVESVDSYRLTYTARPAAPAGLKAVSAGSRQIKLTWKAVTGATGYHVWRSSMSGANYRQIAVVSGYNTLTYTDTNVDTGAVYYYYVVSYVGTTESEPPDSVECMSIPAAVTNAKATSISDTSIKLTWTDSQDVSGYRIMHSETKDGTYEALEPDASSNSYTVTGLETASTHYFRIYAFKTVGGVDVMGEPSVLLFAYPKPAAPTGLKLTNATYRSITLTWNASVGADGYEIWRSTSQNGTYTYVASVTTETYTTAKTLTSGATYYFKVRPFLGTTSVKSGYGNYCTPVGRMVMPPASPYLTAETVSTDSTAVKLSWGRVWYVTGYKIYQSVNGGGKEYVTAVSGSTTLTCTVTKRVPGNKYIFYVLPYIGAVGSNYTASDPIQLELPAPKSLSTASNNKTSFTVAWGSVSGATGYDVYATCDDDPSYLLEDTSTVASYTFNNMTAGYSYVVKVRAYSTASGTRIESLWSDDVTALIRPDKPTSIKATVMSGLKVKLTWAAPAFADGYTIYRSTSLNGAYTELDTINADDILTYTDVLTNSDIGTTYFYRVKSFINPLGTPVYCWNPTGVSATVQPSKTKLYGTPIDSNSYFLYWDAVDGADGYILLRSTSENGTYTTFKTQTEAELTFNSLTPAKKYYFKVRAYVMSGSIKVLGETSDAFLVQAKLAAPAAVTATPAMNKVVVRWSGVTGAQGYYIYRATSATGTYSWVATAASTARSYTNTNLQCGATYYYKVAGYCIYNKVRYPGQKSDYASATTYAVAPSFASTPYTVQSTTRLTIKWNAVAGAQRYYVYASPAYDGTYTKIGEVLAGTTTFVVSDMTMGVYRYFRVKSYANELLSAYSDTLAARATPRGPSSLKATTIWKQTIKINWNASTGADGYVVYYRKKGTTAYTTEYFMGSDIRQASITGLTSKTTYQIRVRPFCIDGDGDNALGGYSAILTVKTK